MQKDQDKRRDQDIAKPVNPSSYDARTDQPPALIIQYQNPQDELNGVYAGQEVFLTAVLTGGNKDDYDFFWRIDHGGFKDIKSRLSQFGQTRYLITVTSSDTICVTTGGAGSVINVTATAIPKVPSPSSESKWQVQSEAGGTGGLSRAGDTGGPRSPELQTTTMITVREPQVSDLKTNFDQKMDQISETIASNLGVTLTRGAITATDDVALWVVIRRSAEAVGFNNYLRFMDLVLCGEDAGGNPLRPGTPAETAAQGLYGALRRQRFLPFNDTDAYRLLKVATEAFLLVNGAVVVNTFPFTAADITDLNVRMGTQSTLSGLNAGWNRYLTSVNGSANPMLPYLSLISQKFRNEPLKNQIFLNEDPALLNSMGNSPENCLGVLRRKLSQPFLIELIWSYWQEEGMLVQTLNAITRRFQNVRIPSGNRDPLANLEIDPLRPLNNLIWGFLQDEQHRLGVARRAHEYDHHYGISLYGKAIRRFRPADSRSKFIEAFHQLLHLCTVFFKQDDDTTVIADGFPVLNALREVHLILSEGAHNQFGDLPSTARQEMLLQQWLLARPEFREYLPTRSMVAYPEPWMDRVDAMKTLQNWTDTSVTHFHNLAVYGEQILLSIRFGGWTGTNQTAHGAANWARFWRAEIQGYIHSYRAVTGVDIAAASTSQRVDSTPPSVHLRNRLAAQKQR